jgi:hypothetical protein
LEGILMTTHFSSNRMAVPSAGVSRIGGRPTRHPVYPSAIGFVSAITVVTVTMVMGAALIMTAPLTVMVPIFTVLGTGLVASALASLVTDRSASAVAPSDA